MGETIVPSSPGSSCGGPPYSPISNASLVGDEHPLQNFNGSSNTSTRGPEEDQDSILLLERRSFRPFKSSEDYLYAMREDLAEWLKGLYDLNISAHDFFERLENGVLLCQHANNVRTSAQEHLVKNGKKLSTKYEIPMYEVYFRRDSAPGSFFARDNVHNFIKWCRDLGVHDVLMFETDDLVLRKNEKHVILALLEIARRGASYGMAAPLLVQMEADIDREIEKDRIAMENSMHAEGQEGLLDSWAGDIVQEEPQEPPNLIYGPQVQVVTNDLKSLDEMVRDLVERCTCPSQFPMIKVSEGKYRIGDTKVLIFVRILRNHVMVRVGGGWDTLHHYLDKHDPCRCRAGHRGTIASKLGFKTSHSGDRDLKSVSYKRSEEGFSPSSPAQPRRKSTGFRRTEEVAKQNLRNRSQSPAFRDNISNSPRINAKYGRFGMEDNSEMWLDSGSEISDEGYKGGPPRLTLRSSRFSNKRNPQPDLLERPDSSMTQLSSEGSSVSTDDSGVPLTPPRSPPTVMVPSSRPWTSTPLKTIPVSQIPRSSTTKNKYPTMESLIANKKPKSKSISDPASGRRAWNAGPGIRESSLDQPRSRRSSVSSETSEGGGGTTGGICRSRSATSDGGFQSMLLRKDSIGRQSLRSISRRNIPTPSEGKNTWNGRTYQRGGDYPTESFRPPLSIRSMRSSSASPATARRTFGSAPGTPINNRSPKRSAPTSTLHSPTHHPVPLTCRDILPSKVEYNPDAENADLLAHIEDLVNDYRTKVYNMFLSEGKPMPPELSDEVESQSWGNNDKENTNSNSKLPPQQPASSSTPPTSKENSTLKPTPRKSGLGSRIPAPVF